MLFLGDTHGTKWNNPHPNEPIYCVGDCGVGFPNFTPEIPFNGKFIAGNHDDRMKCLEFPQYLGHYGIDPNTGIFFISGAWSIDKIYRTPGKDWWEYEQLSIEEGYAAIDLYMQVKPDLVLAHDFPESLYKPFLQTLPMKNTTIQLFDAMWSNHRPKIWVGGHHHKTRDQVILDTRFVCLNIQEVKDLPI